MATVIWVAWLFTVQPCTEARAYAATAATSESANTGQLKFTDGYAEVKSLLNLVGKAENQASYYAEQSRERHGWTLDELGTSGATRALEASHGAKRRRCGGIPPLVAQKHVLVQMCKDWSGL